VELAPAIEDNVTQYTLLPWGCAVLLNLCLLITSFLTICWTLTSLLTDGTIPPKRLSYTSMLLVHKNFLVSVSLISAAFDTIDHDIYSLGFHPGSASMALFSTGLGPTSYLAPSV